MLKVAGINFESIVDGDGVRVVIFFSGCKHDCKGCHNPSSHDFNAGKDFDESLRSEIIEYVLETPFVAGITLSGGDPMYSADEIFSFVRDFKTALPDKDVWVYSGFTYEEITPDVSMNKLLSLCDVLVDGLFVLEQRDITLSYKGSRNQRIIDVQKSLESGSVVLWNI
jgi:anaerobic ribonucleoside-triphosphate reductase activating protein